MLICSNYDQSYMHVNDTHTHTHTHTLVQGRKFRFTLDKIGFKDENLALVDPKICAYMATTSSINGVQVESKVSQTKSGKYFLFEGDTLEFQQPLESMVPGDLTIYRCIHAYMCVHMHICFACG
jgi:hypothetical protein